MTTAIIGAGYAGLACAVELAARGQKVDVFEASRTLGGRARAADLGDWQVDNGQHILVGAYSETLRLMRQVGADPDRLFKRTPLHLEFPGQFRLRAPQLPAPLHTAFALLGAQGLSWREKLAAIRLMQGLQRARFRIEPDLPVSEWLSRHQVPPRQRTYLWEPLCIAALNTPAHEASAQVLANVLRDSLAAGRAASDLLLPQVDLSALFPEPAAAWLAARGSRLQRGQRIGPLTQTAEGWQIDDGHPGGRHYRQVVIAVAPHHLGALHPALAERIAHLHWEPIVTTYLSYPPDTRLAQPMLGVAEGVAQWLFDRGQLCGQLGLLAAVISAHGRHLDLPAAELEARIHDEIATLLPGLPLPRWARTVTEKRATFACRPGLQRPATASGLPGLWLAGDYVAGDYPATIEGAVRSGVAAANAVLASPPV